MNTEVLFRRTALAVSRTLRKRLKRPKVTMFLKIQQGEKYSADARALKTENI